MYHMTQIRHRKVGSSYAALHFSDNYALLVSSLAFRVAIAVADSFPRSLETVAFML